MLMIIKSVSCTYFNISVSRNKIKTKCTRLTHYFSVTTTTISLGTWNHYTVTFNTNSGGLKIYENGVETASRDDLANYPILKAGYQVFGQVT